jgi:hypothetical protein
MTPPPTAPRQMWPGSAVCGLISVAGLAVVFAHLSDHHVPGAYSSDLSVVLTLGPVVALVCALGGYAAGRRAGSRWLRRHAVLPFLLVALVPATVGLAGGEWSKLETGALWGATAMALHLLVGTRARRRWIVAGLVLTVAVAYGGTVLGQQRWRTQLFARLDLPLYVPDVPGYRVAGAYPGTGRAYLTLRTGAAPDSATDLVVTIERYPPFERCRTEPAARWVSPPSVPPGGLWFCLPDSAVLTISAEWPGTRQWDRLLPAVRLRPADARVLAALPPVWVHEAD